MRFKGSMESKWVVYALLMFLSVAIFFIFFQPIKPILGDLTCEELQEDSLRRLDGLGDSIRLSSQERSKNFPLDVRGCTECIWYTSSPQSLMIKFKGKSAESMPTENNYLNIVCPDCPCTNAKLLTGRKYEFIVSRSGIYCINC